MGYTLEQYEIVGGKDPATNAVVKGKFPTGAGTFKKYYQTLIKDARVNVDGIFGDDDDKKGMGPLKLSTSQVGYMIKLTRGDVDKVDKLLEKGGGIPKRAGKPDMFYDTSSKGGKPRVSLDYGPENAGFRITLEATDARPRTAESRGKGNKPSTPQQEKCTMKIIELVLGKNTKWMPKMVTGPNADKGNRELFDKFIIPDLKKIYPDILSHGRRDWYMHFLTQFRDVQKVKGGPGAKIKIPNNQFNIYKYGDDDESFMKLIEDLIQKEGPPDVKDKNGNLVSWEQNPHLPPFFKPPAGRKGEKVKEGTWPEFGKISKKDSWNPADIWLARRGTEYDKLRKELQSVFTIKEVNKLLRIAFDKGVLIGISLKKTDATVVKLGTSHWEMVNMKFEPKTGKTVQDPLAKVKAGPLTMDFPWDGKTFSKTSYEWIVISGTKRDKFRMGTAGSEIAMMNYEMYPSKGAAGYGKVPKDIMREYLKVQPSTNYKDPSKWAKQASNNKSNFLLPEVENMKEMLPLVKNDDNYKEWIKVRDDIKKFHGFTIHSNGLDNVVDNLLTTSKNSKGKLTKQNNVVMQMLLWVHLCIGFEEKKGLDNLLKGLYYMAQKKGVIGMKEFGPFHKWS